MRLRLAFVSGLAALTGLSAAATLAVAHVLAAPAPAELHVAGVRATLPAADRPAPAARPKENASAERTVVGFLDALRAGDYARACDQLLRADGCEDQLAATNAGVVEYRLVSTTVSGSEAVVDAVADGMKTRFMLLRRSARWWIAALDIAPPR